MRYSIGRCAQLTGLGIHTLRYYEQEGLLHPARNSGNQRVYTQEDLAWIAFLKRLKAIGMSLRQIRRYADLRAQGEETMKKRLQLLEEFRDELAGEIEALKGHMQAFDEKIGFYQDRISEKEK